MIIITITIEITLLVFKNNFAFWIKFVINPTCLILVFVEELGVINILLNKLNMTIKTVKKSKVKIVNNMYIPILPNIDLNIGFVSLNTNNFSTTNIHSMMVSGII
jgi:hypothetical protein